MYKIIIDKEAEKALKKLPRQEQKRIIAKIEGLAKNPRPSGVKALQGNLQSFFRVRIGDYRIIYIVEDKILTVYVVKVGHRGHIYDD